MGNPKNIDGLSSRGLPSKIGSNTRGPVRTDQYGNLVMLPIGGMRHTLADQGSYFVAHNPTNDASTTLALHPAPVLVDADATMTKPFIHLRNPTAAAQDLRCYLDFIEIDIVTAATGATTTNWAAQLDTGATRVTTAGTTFTTINPNMQSTATPSLAVQGGVVVTGAESSSVRELGHGQIRSAIEIIGDRYLFRFGGQPSPGANVVASAASRHLITLPPVVLGSTDQFLLALYGPSWSGASVAKVRCGWWEI
jgi:hypothetical protein